MKKQTVIGVILIVLGIVAFAAHWYVLLEPLQEHYVEANRHPAVPASTLLGGLAGVVVGTLLTIGTALKKDKVFGVKHTAFSFKGLFKSSSYWKFMLCWFAGFALFTFFWAQYNF